MKFGLRQLIFFTVLVAVPVSSYFLVFRPQNAEISRAKAEIEHKRAMLQKLREATAKAPDLERANAEIAESIRAIEARLPSDKEVDDILRQVASLADKNGLQVPVFKKGDKPLPAGLALEQPLEVEFTGDFDGFYNFLLDLEQLPRITRLPDLGIERNDKVDGDMRASMTLSIYYQDDRSGGTSR